MHIRVRVMRDLDYAEPARVRAGETGAIVRVTEDMIGGTTTWVLLDKHHEGLQDNALWFNACTPPLCDSVEPIRVQPRPYFAWPSLLHVWRVAVTAAVIILSLALLVEGNHMHAKTYLDPNAQHTHT